MSQQAMSQQALPCTPPPKPLRVGSFFSHRCLVPPKFFPQRKVDFVGDIEIKHKKRAFVYFFTKINLSLHDTHLSYTIRKVEEHIYKYNIK